MTTLDLATLLVHLKLDSKGFQEGTSQAATKTKSFQQSLTDNLISVTALKEGLELAKKAFDFGKEGASLLKLEESFDSLALSVDTTAGVLLGQLRASTAGMVADTELMSAANRFLAMNLAETGEQAAELSNVAVTLGSAFGKGANQSLEEFALLLANQSIPRLDTFGISAASVRGRIAELQAQNAGMSRETAFMTAVMDEAAISMDRLGNGIQTDAFTGFEVSLKNVTDQLKMMVAEGLTPVLDFLGQGLEEMKRILNDYGEEAAASSQSTIEMTEGFEALEARLTKVAATKDIWLGMGTVITGTTDEVNGAIVALSGKLALASEDSLQFNLGILRAGISLEEFEELLGMTTTEFFNYQQAVHSAESFDQSFTEAQIYSAQVLDEKADALSAATAAQIEHNTAVYQASPAYDEFSDKALQASNLISEEEGHLRGLQQQHDRATSALVAGKEATEAYNAAVQSFNETLAQNFVSALNSSEGIGFYNESMDELGQQSAFVSNMTNQQSEDLTDLQNAYDKAADKVRDYELGLAGANLTEEQRAEKIAEQQEIMAGLAPTIDELNGLGGEYISWTQEATINQEAVNQALFDAAAASGASAADLAILGGALGLYSEEATQAALKSALIQAKIDELAAAYVNGSITVGGMQGALASFISGLDSVGPAAEGASTAVSGATAALSEQDAALAEKLGVFDEAAGTASGNAETAFGDIESSAEEHMGAAASIVDEQAGAILGSVEEAFGEMSGAAETSNGEMVAAFETGMEGVVTAVGVGLEGAVTTATGYEAQFGAVGSNIVSSMTNELLAGGGALAAAAGQIVEQALAAAEAAAEAQSPSRRAMRLSDDIIEGLIIRLEDGSVDVAATMAAVIGAAFDAAGDTISAGRRIGNAAEFFADMLVDPAEAALESLDEQLGSAADSIAEQMGGFLPDLSGDLNSLIASAEAAGDLKLAEELRGYQALQQERNAAEQEYIAQQEKLLALQEQQQQLAFLQSQLDLIEQLQGAGLNPATVLEGITLGLDASADDLLAASSAAMQALIEQANLQLGVAQTTATSTFGQIFGGIDTTATGVEGATFDAAGGGTSTGGSSGGSGPGPGNVTINFYGDVYGFDDFAEQVRRVTAQSGRQIDLRIRN